MKCGRELATPSGELDPERDGNDNDNDNDPEDA
jgi:hypothetical protein